ncbi:hypothetical protein MMC11_004516 [Xylographa trunciseda]|nr:hypothetical protein [Xylographa trunciseda]
MTHIREFLGGIGDRKLFLSELSFQFVHLLASSVFRNLRTLEFLTKLHIVMDIGAVPILLLNRKRKNDWPAKFCLKLRHAPGIASLLQIKGMEVLDITGRDRVEDSSQWGRLEDINHEDAIGPIMMKIMLSRSAYEILFGVE